MADAGCQCVYVVDSAGALVPAGGDRARRRRCARRSTAPPTVGFHGHENLACGVANTLRGDRAGAPQVDAALAGSAPGAGNTPTEALVAVLEKLGIVTGIDVERASPTPPRTSSVR